MKRTNEELALLARQGDTAARDELWEQNQGLLLTLFARYFPLCQKHHCEPDDLMQCGWFAVCKAVEAFDPAKGYKFNTYLHRHVQNAVAECFDTRGTKQRPVEVSGSTPIGEDKDMELLDTLPDQSAAEAVATAEERIYTEQLHQTLDAAMERLTERQRAVITRRFYDGDAYDVLAADYGLSVAGVRRDQQNGLCRMGRDKRLMGYRADILSHASRRVGVNQYRESGASSVEAIVEQLEAFYRRLGIPYTFQRSERNTAQI